MQLSDFRWRPALKGSLHRQALGAAAFGLTLALLAASPAGAQESAVAEPVGCRLVRLSDIGWTDVTATTALTSTLLKSLGYQTQVTLLSVPVTFASMRNATAADTTAKA